MGSVADFSVYRPSDGSDITGASGRARETVSPWKGSGSLKARCSTTYQAGIAMRSGSNLPSGRLVCQAGPLGSWCYDSSFMGPAWRVSAPGSAMSFWALIFTHSGSYYRVQLGYYTGGAWTATDTLYNSTTDPRGLSGGVGTQGLLFDVTWEIDGSNINILINSVKNCDGSGDPNVSIFTDGQEFVKDNTGFTGTQVGVLVDENGTIATRFAGVDQYVEYD